MPDDTITIELNPREQRLYERLRASWLDHGVDVTEIDHGWCTSIYAQDPNGILVEFCTSTREFDAQDKQEALRLLTAESAELGDSPSIKIHRAADRPGS